MLEPWGSADQSHQWRNPALCFLHSWHCFGPAAGRSHAFIMIFMVAITLPRHGRRGVRSTARESSPSPFAFVNAFREQKGFNLPIRWLLLSALSARPPEPL